VKAHTKFIGQNVVQCLATWGFATSKNIQTSVF